MVVPVLVLSCVIFVPGSCPPPTSLSTVGWSYRYSSMSKVCILYVYICSHFGSIPIQVETPCNKFKFRMTKGPPRLQAETYTQKNQNSKLGILKIGSVRLELKPSDELLVREWYHSEASDPIRFERFCRLVVRAYRKWYLVVHINNKIVKKNATSVGASSTKPSAN